MATAEMSTPSRASRSVLTRPKSSAPTVPTIAADPPILPHWSMKIAGAPEG